MKKWFLYLSIFYFIVPNTLYAYTIADSFQYPVAKNAKFYTSETNEGWIVGQDHQDCREKAVPAGITACRHLGEDWSYREIDGHYINERKAIHAVANGYVAVSGVKAGFAGYVIMKHYLSDESYVLSIYGHLQVNNLPAAGTYFEKGQHFASTATDAEMKQYTNFAPHLHFEIRKAKNITGFNDATLNDGYDDDSTKKYYYDPTDVVTIDWDTGAPISSDWNNDTGFIESHESQCVQGYAGSSNTPSALNEFQARFGIKNDCGEHKTIQDVAISFHNKDTRDFMQTCYRKYGDLELNSGEYVLTENQHCNQNPVITQGEYLLVYKVKYDNSWKEVLEKHVKILAPDCADSVNSIPVYRLYNTLLQVHLYTTDENEKTVLEADSDWNYERAVWDGYESDTGQYPVYRLYSSGLGKHLFTMDVNEKNVLAAGPVWQFEKIAWYANSTPCSGDIPIYRLYSDSLKQHLYTADVNEKNTLDGNGVWVYEGIAYYAMPSSLSEPTSSPFTGDFKYESTDSFNTTRSHTLSITQEGDSISGTVFTNIKGCCTIETTGDLNGTILNDTTAKVTITGGMGGCDCPPDDNEDYEHILTDMMSGFFDYHEFILKNNNNTLISTSFLGDSGGWTHEFERID